MKVRGVRRMSSGPNDKENSNTLKRMKGAGFAGGEKECAFYLDMINNLKKNQGKLCLM